MARILVAVVLALACGTVVFSQGLVDFANTSTKLISTNNLGPISGGPGAYYFGLFIAPQGTADWSQFVFTGCYATNTAVAGRLSGGNAVPVPNWPAGQSRAFLVRGWSATLGHDWSTVEPQVLTANWQSAGFYGESSIAEGVAGGFDGTNAWPSFPIFKDMASGLSLNPGCLMGQRWQGFTAHPTNQAVVLGGKAVFTAHAIACPSPHYQWYRNGAPITGANSRDHLITNVQPQHAGQYYAILSGYWRPGFLTLESYTSSSAALTVLVPPTVTAQPVSRTAEEGSDTRFSVRATGTAPISYQWFLNGNADLSGASTNSSLQLTNLQFSHSGAYTVVVTNVAGVVTSVPAMLNVIAGVPRRMVPALLLAADPATLLYIDDSPRVDPPRWRTWPPVYLTNSPQFYFDLSSPLPAQRFYRVWQTGAPGTLPSVSLPGMVPAISLTGTIGGSIRIDCINQFGPTDAWVPLARVPLTSSPQLFFDTNSLGHPPRLYRLIP